MISRRRSPWQAAVALAGMALLLRWSTCRRLSDPPHALTAVSLALYVAVFALFLRSFLFA